MESFYTYSNFFRLLGALGALCFLVPRLVLKADSLHEKLFHASAICLVVIQALAPIVPYPEIQRIMPVFLWLSVPGTAAWILLFIRRKDNPDLRHHQAWIIDTLRESVLIFDSRFNLIERSGIRDNLDSCGYAGLVKELKSRIKGESVSETPSESLFHCGDRIYRYRFQPVSGGYLLTLLDMTEEQKLVDELMDKNRLLQRRHTLLASSETGELETRREKYRLDISSRILEMVREKLQEIEILLRETGEIEPALKCAGEAMTDIRRAVSRFPADESDQ